MAGSRRLSPQLSCLLLSWLSSSESWGGFCRIIAECDDRILILETGVFIQSYGEGWISKELRKFPKISDHVHLLLLDTYVDKIQLNVLWPRG